MIEIKESNFQPLDMFPIKWRWTDTRWNKLSDDSLNKIRPLSENNAQQLSQYSLNYSEQSGLKEVLFDHVEQINASGEVSEVRLWLFSCSPNLTQTVIVSWNDRLAVLTEWQVFCEYWNDFCYPASDDVAIFPLSEEWLLLYSHEEYFNFGERGKLVAEDNSLKVI